MTIIAIAGLTLLLVGLVTVLTLEQKTARSYSHSARADFAVESGLAAALANVMEITGRDDSLVFRLEDPVAPTVADADRPLGYREQFFNYGAIFEQDPADPTLGEWRAIPLFSGESEISITDSDPSVLGVPLDTTDLVSSLTAYVADAEVLATTTKHDQDIPRAQWVEVPSSDPDGYTFRYAYWIEDLSGRIDGKNAGTVVQDERLSTAELDYGTVFDPEADEPTVPEDLENKREHLKTSASVRAVIDEDKAKRIEPYIYFFPTTPASAAKLIPQGLGYTDAGTVAPDLNELVAAADVDGITDHIKRNLPLFDDRKGG
ncbi:MAG: hypothetical protein ACSHX7_13455, partial [Luteolibacter sp.]